MPRGKTLLLAGGASISNATFSGTSTFTGTPVVANSVYWSGYRTDGTTAIQLIGQNSSNLTVIDPSASSGFVLFGNTDNTVTLGDATHRIATVHAKSITIGQSIANPVMGVVTLSGGTGTASVQTTAMTAGARIFLTHQNAAGTTGTARVTSSTVGTGFTIVSSSSTDTSTIGWWIVPVS